MLIGVYMSNVSERVKRWRNKTKEKIVLAMGGKCQICGYDKCSDALELHHIDPSKKELSFSRVRANPISIQKISEELKKCILLCSNCHREIHAGLVELPEKYSVLNEDILLDKGNKICKKEGCGNKIPIVFDRDYCSPQCAGYDNALKGIVGR